MRLVNRWLATPALEYWHLPLGVGRDRYGLDYRIKMEPSYLSYIGSDQARILILEDFACNSRSRFGMECKSYLNE